MIDVVPPQCLIELDAIAFTKLDAATTAGTMTLHCLYLGRALSLPAVPLLLTAGTAAQRLLTLRTDHADRQHELTRHLRAHRDHYSRTVFRALELHPFGHRAFESILITAHSVSSPINFPPKVPPQPG